MLKIIQYTEGMDIEAAAPCVIANMPNEVYHSSPGISKSGLDAINRSPAHYKFGEHKTSKAMELGTALHAAVLEPEIFDDEFLMLPDVKDRRASEYKKATKSLPDKIVLVGKEVGQVDGMVKAVNDHRVAKQLVDGCKYRELSFYGYHPDLGILCKCRFDALSWGGGDSYIAVDLKTTKDAMPEEFSKSIFNYRYHVQAPYYAWVFNWATGLTLDRFWFVAVESTSPHGVICRFLDDDTLSIGSADANTNLETYKGCLETNYWPCYEQPENLDDCMISLPGWAMSSMEDDLVGEIV